MTRWIGEEWRGEEMGVYVSQSLTHSLIHSLARSLAHFPLLNRFEGLRYAHR